MRTVCLVALAVLAACCATAGEPKTDPALRLHGHNDYRQPVPLHAALELGLGSVEADRKLREELVAYRPLLTRFAAAHLMADSATSRPCRRRQRTWCHGSARPLPS